MAAISGPPIYLEEPKWITFPQMELYPDAPTAEVIVFSLSLGVTANFAFIERFDKPIGVYFGNAGTTPDPTQPSNLQILNGIVERPLIDDSPDVPLYTGGAGRPDSEWSFFAIPFVPPGNGINQSYKGGAGQPFPIGMGTSGVSYNGSSKATAIEQMFTMQAAGAAANALEVVTGRNSAGNETIISGQTGTGYIVGADILSMRLQITDIDKSLVDRHDNIPSLWRAGRIAFAHLEGIYAPGLYKAVNNSIFS